MVPSRCAEVLIHSSLLFLKQCTTAEESLTGLPRIPIHLTEQPHCLISNSVSHSYADPDGPGFPCTTVIQGRCTEVSAHAVGLQSQARQTMCFLPSDMPCRAGEPPRLAAHMSTPPWHSKRLAAGELENK